MPSNDRWRTGHYRMVTPALLAITLLTPRFDYPSPVVTPAARFISPNPDCALSTARGVTSNKADISMPGFSAYQNPVAPSPIGLISGATVLR